MLRIQTIYLLDQYLYKFLVNSNSYFNKILMNKNKIETIYYE